MDRIARLIELENISGAAHNAIRWEAAHLYWQEVQSGRTKADLAREIGKTQMHVMYMYRCWDYIRQVGVPRDGDAFRYAAIKDFNEVYHSDEVRKPADRKQRKPGRDGERERTGRKTTYNGIEMRSRLEADFAEALDRRGLDWKYEPKCFASKTGQWLPDFWIDAPSYGHVWVELKPANYDAVEIAGQLRRIAVAWASEPDATIQLVLWKFREGSALVFTGRAGAWNVAISA